jgi:hypothetical protein
VHGPLVSCGHVAGVCWVASCPCGKRNGNILPSAGLFVHELRVRNTLMAHRESAEPPHSKARSATRYLHATETERVGRRQQHVAWSERAVAAFVTFSAYCLGSWHSFKNFGDSIFFIQVTILHLPILFCNEFSI